VYAKVIMVRKAIGSLGYKKFHKALGDRFSVIYRRNGAAKRRRDRKMAYS
jgi:hypothetical protein